MKKIFYCWQKTTSGNKSYIEHCLREAISSYEDYEVDQATRNQRGAVDIYESILSKIDECDLFVADVSIVNGKNEDPKKHINTNVAFETGYAIAKKSKGDITLIANSQTSNDKDMPFDVRNLRTAYLEFSEANKPLLVKLLKDVIQSHQASGGSTDRDLQIYVSLLAHGSEGSMHISVSNQEKEQFTLDSFEIGGIEKVLNISLPPEKLIEYTGLTGLPRTPYKQKTKYISYVVSDNKNSYRIKQRINLSPHPFDGYELNSFDQRHFSIQRLKIWRSHLNVIELVTNIDGKEYRVTDFDTEQSFILIISSDAFAGLGSLTTEDQFYIAERFAYAYNNKFEGERNEPIKVTTHDIGPDLNTTIESIS